MRTRLIVALVLSLLQGLWPAAAMAHVAGHLRASAAVASIEAHCEACPADAGGQQAPESARHAGDFSCCGGDHCDCGGGASLAAAAQPPFALHLPRTAPQRPALLTAAPRTAVPADLLRPPIPA